MDEISTYLKLIDIQNESYNKRKDTEWKLSLFFWIGIAVVTAFIVENETVSISSYELGPYYFLTFLVSVFRTARISQSHTTDRRFIDYYRNRVEINLKETVKELPRPKVAGIFAFVKDPWAWFQLITTTVFLTFSHQIVEAL